jgi:hypothetical protein
MNLVKRMKEKLYKEPNDLAQSTKSAITKACIQIQQGSLPPIDQFPKDVQDLIREEMDR